MSRIARSSLVALVLAAVTVAGLTTSVMTEASAAPGSSCEERGSARTCVHEDGRVTTDYVDKSDGSAGKKDKGSGGGDQPPAPPVSVPDCGSLGGIDYYCWCGGDTPHPMVDLRVCDANPDGDPAGPSRTQILSTVNRAVATLRLPEGEPQIAPDPQANEWQMLVVGYPVWLTSSAPETTSTTVTRNGITIRIQAARTRTVFDMAEEGVTGASVSCTTMRPRPANMWPHDAPSPDCGYTYVHKGLYTITATTTWQIAWRAGGLSGSLTTTRTTPIGTPLKIGELVAVIIDTGP